MLAIEVNKKSAKDKVIHFPFVMIITRPKKMDPSLLKA
jgi:hypothetical protein